MFMDHPTLKSHFNDAMNKIMSTLSQPSLDRGGLGEEMDGGGG